MWLLVMIANKNYEIHILYILDQLSDAKIKR